MFIGGRRIGLASGEFLPQPGVFFFPWQIRRVRRTSLEKRFVMRAQGCGVKLHCRVIAFNFFRVGEILRSAEDGPRALVEFRWCAANGEGTEFRARARLEIGHLERREGRWREALEAYMDVAADARAAPARRDDAWLWAGTAWSALGRSEDARAAWRRVAEQGSDDLLRIAAFDELALAWLEGDDPEAAAGELARCLEALSARALEETETGERVRNALLRMRVVGELSRAIARRASTSDAPRSARSP